MQLRCPNRFSGNLAQSRSSVQLHCPNRFSGNLAQVAQIPSSVQLHCPNCFSGNLAQVAQIHRPSPLIVRCGEPGEPESEDDVTMEELKERVKMLRDTLRLHRDILENIFEDSQICSFDDLGISIRALAKATALERVTTQAYKEARNSLDAKLKRLGASDEREPITMTTLYFRLLVLTQRVRLARDLVKLIFEDTETCSSDDLLPAQVALVHATALERTVTRQYTECRKALFAKWNNK